MACIPIASQIVKETVPEFSDMSLDDIGKCFLSVDSACIGVDTDTTHTAVRQAIGLSTEDKTVSEGVVTYDVKLLVQNPKTQERSVLIINLEAQNISNAKRLGYDLVKRAVYYASRLISSQKGELFCELLGNKLPSFLLQPPLLSNTKRITKSYTMSTSVRLG